MGVGVCGVCVSVCVSVCVCVCLECFGKTGVIRNTLVYPYVLLQSKGKGKR